jgi:L-threonylcarbamoyladenylate synthase
MTNMMFYHSPAVIKDAAASLISGNLVAFPTETVYGLGADACNEKAVARIYETKGRPINHPLIVHVSSINVLDKWAREIPDYAIKLAKNFWPGPMTLILPRTELAKNFITGNQDNVGIRVPSHPVALSLLNEFESLGRYGVAAPSANRFGKISPTSASDVKEELSSYLHPEDIVLDGGQSLVGVESTIIKCTDSIPVILRPGAITQELIKIELGIDVDYKFYSPFEQNIRVPGQMYKHYSPKAKVYLNEKPRNGSGFLALSKFPTPKNVIRLSSPKDSVEFARVLYSALRMADRLNLPEIYVVPPEDNDIAVAINERLKRISNL